MIEQLINSLKSEVGSQILNQTKLPEGSLNKVFSVIGDVAKKEVTGQMLSGDLSGVLNLFSKQPNNNAANLLQSNIISGVISNLSKKLGLSPQISNTIATIAVPALINMITQKNSATPDDDPSPLNEIFGKGKSSMLGGVAKGILGKLLKR
jgi:hypothetical protein